MDLPTTHYDDALVTPRPENRVEAVKKTGILTRISVYLMIGAAFLSPLFFIPSNYAPLDVVKSFFLSFFIIIAALLYSIDSLKQKSFALPRSVFGYSVIAIVISTLLSAIVSGNFLKSFIGQGFEITSASFVLLMVVAAYLVSRLIVRDREVVFKIYSAIFVAFVLLALFHIVRFFAGANFLSFGLLSTVTSTLAGKWYDFAALTAVTGILSLLGIKFLSLQKGLRALLSVSLLVSGLILFVVNSAFLWTLLAIVLLGIAAYEFAASSKEGKTRFARLSILTLVAFVIAVVCAWKGNIIAAPAVNYFKAQYGELVLPWQMTLDITSDTLKQAPVFGAGPNRFGLQYLRYKPAVINQTPFWSSEFTGGFGFLPSIVVTQGILGALVWVLFLAFFIREGVRALRRATDPLKKFFISSSFFSASLLWLVALTYVPSQTTLFLTALFTGIFVALVVSEGVVSERVVSGNTNKLVPVLLYVSVIVLVVWLGVYAKKAVAITYFQKGIKELATSRSTDNAQMAFKKALSWDSSDVYYQALSETNILKINALAQEIQADVQKGATPDKAKTDAVLALISDSLKYTKNAQAIDPLNYYNYLAEARISEIGTTLKIDNAYTNARNAYASAIQTNPSSPALYLNLARLEASQNKLQDAQQYIGRALQMKPNYTEAIFFLSQLQVANNQIKDAMVSTQVAIQLNPQEPLLYFQLGLLAYSDKDYTLAIQALEKAVQLNKDYANAQYFLGLSYARMGRNADAIAQFEQLAITNPDNQEVAFILTNLKEGKSPFADAQPPIDNKPEKRKTLPVPEKETKTTTPAAKKTSSQ
jgi:tetratricopeptide (TPR) repeat protein